MASLKQIGVAFIGLAIGGGFAFGGIASYAGMVNTGPSQQNQQANLSLPSRNYQESAIDRTAREQLAIAMRNDVVFVNAFYENESQKQKMEQELSGLPEKFNNRVYVGIASSTSGSDVLIQYGITEYPRVVVIGGNRQYQSRPLKQVDSEKVSSEICSAFRSLGSNAANCLN